jgi:hypothetical protein
VGVAEEPHGGRRGLSRGLKDASAGMRGRSEGEQRQKMLALKQVLLFWGLLRSPFLVHFVLT